MRINLFPNLTQTDLANFADLCIKAGEVNLATQAKVEREARRQELAEVMEDVRQEKLASIEPDTRTLEIHLGASSYFTAKGWSAKVKRLGGSYSECRGNSFTRFVSIPLTEEALEAGALELAAELVARFGNAGHGRGCAIIWRGGRAKDRVAYLRKGEGQPPVLDQLQAAHEVRTEESLSAQLRFWADQSQNFTGCFNDLRAAALEKRPDLG